MPVSEKQKEYAKKYIEKLDDIKIRPEKGTKELWKREAAERGMSLNQFIIYCVDKEIKSGEFAELRKKLNGLDK